MFKHKFLPLLVALFATTLCAHAQYVEVHKIDGKYVSGRIISRTDTTLIVQQLTTYQQLKFTPDDVVQVDLEDGNALCPENNRFIFRTREEIQAKIRAKKQEESQIRMGDPNYVIGKAMKTTGGSCMGIGVPMAFVGAILVGVGSKEVTVNDKMSEKEIKDAVYKAKTRANCMMAGCVLLPLGASFTVVGIPLFVQGKQFMEMKVNYTGKGAGLTFVW